MVILPILYEIGNVVVKYLAAKQRITLPLFVSPFLTTKSPLVMVMFIAMAMYIKGRERLFIKNGKTHEDYQAFLKTNTNSFQFSRFMIIMIILLQFFEVIFYTIVGIIIIKHNGNMSTEEIKLTSQILKSIGIGDSMDMLGLIPFLLVFSYTKLHKREILDIVIPLVGILIIVLIYIDSAYVIIHDLANNMMNSYMIG